MRTSNKILFLVTGTGGTQALIVMEDYISHQLNRETLIINVSPTIAKSFPHLKYIPDLEPLLRAVDEYNPDVIFTETSHMVDVIKEALPILDKKYYIVSIQDVWDTDNHRYADYEPRLICVPTETCLQEQISFGRSNVILYTNPAFITLGKVKSRLKRRIPKIIYMSQSFYYRKEMYEVIAMLEEILDDFDLTIQLHPEEGYLDNCKYKQIYSKELPYDYDLVIGHSSTVQLKTTIIGIPTIYYDENIRVNIENFKDNKPLITSPYYGEYIKCVDREAFEKKTKMLLRLLDI